MQIDSGRMTTFIGKSAGLYPLPKTATHIPEEDTEDYYMFELQFWGPPYGPFQTNGQKIKVNKRDYANWLNHKPTIVWVENKTPKHDNISTRETSS